MLRVNDYRVNLERRATDIVFKLAKNNPTLTLYLREDFRGQVVRALEIDPKRGSECVSERDLIDQIVDTTYEIHHDLGTHLENVGILAAAIAEEMKAGIEDPDTELCYKGGAIHDIGKLDPVIYSIISYPGKLALDEKLVTSSHAELGYRVLKRFDIQEETALMALQHHERIDGTGYPQRLPEEKISLETRIVSVADAVDAMLQDRPGRKGMGIRDIVHQLIRGAGTHFDERVVKAYLRICKNLGYPNYENISNRDIM